MFIKEIDTDDVHRWVDEDARYIADIVGDSDGDVEEDVRRSIYLVEERRCTDIYDVLAIVAEYNPYEAAHGLLSFEDSPIECYLTDVYNKALGLIEDRRTA